MNEKVQTMLDLIVPTWARDWLGKQRVEVVLLFGILAMIAYGVPYIVNRMDGHIDKIVSAFESDQERDEKRNERKDELIRDLLQRNGLAAELKPAENLQ